LHVKLPFVIRRLRSAELFSSGWIDDYNDYYMHIR
jgi:hypothetical protein